MTPTQLTNRIDALVEDSSAEFLTQVAKDQEKLLQETKALIRELEVKNGLLTKTTKNLRTIRKLDQKMRKSLDESGYSKRVDDFNQSYGIVSDLQNEYFAGLAAAFTPNESFLRA